VKQVEKEKEVKKDLVKTIATKQASDPVEAAKVAEKINKAEDTAKIE